MWRQRYIKVGGLWDMRLWDMGHRTQDCGNTGTSKHPNNQTTEQSNNRTTKQENNQTREQKSAYKNKALPRGPSFINTSMTDKF